MNRLRGWRVLVLFVLPLVASACASVPENVHVELPQQYRIPQANLATILERRSGRIALIDEEGNLVVMDQTGGAVARLTRDAAALPDPGQVALTYRWPVWSPDGSQIAFVENTAERATSSRIIELGADAVLVQRGKNSITIEQSEAGTSIKSSPETRGLAEQPGRVIIEGSTGGKVLSSAVYAARVDSKGPLQELYSSDKGPIEYLDWSPDSSQIAFLTRTGEEEMTLNLVPRESGAARELLTGVSTAWHWSPDAKTLLAKVDTSSTTFDADLSLLDAQAGKVTTSIAQRAVLPFDSPAFSPDGNAMLLTTSSDGTTYLALADRQGNVQRKLTPVNGRVRFSWSPVEARVAYIVEEANGDALSFNSMQRAGALHLLDVNSGEDKVLSQVPVAGFFWSPSGEFIAAFNPVRLSDITAGFPGVNLISSSASAVFMLQTININTHASRQLFYFEPTTDFRELLRQFDRYSRAMNIWAPDSRHMVFPAVYTTSQRSYNLIFETESSGSIEPRVISEGTIAVWSPR